MTNATITTTPAPQIRARRQAALEAAESDIARATSRVSELEELARKDLPDHQLRNAGLSDEEIEQLRHRLRSLPSDMTYWREQLGTAQRAAAGWRLALDQPGSRIRLRATTNIAGGYGTHRFHLAPGQEISVPDEVALPLIANGAAEVVLVPPLSKPATRGSVDLRKDLAMIDERRQRRREALAEAEAELQTAHDALRELQASQELDGAKVQPGQVAKAEARVSEAERSVRGKRAGFEVEVERTESVRVELEAALAHATGHEAEEARAAEEEARDAEAIRRRTRTIAAYEALEAALSAEHAFGGDVTVYAPSDLRETIGRLRTDPLTKIALAAPASTTSTTAAGSDGA